MPPKPQAAAAVDLAAALGLLLRRLRLASATEDRDLSWSQMAVIGRIARSPVPLTTAELARAEGIKPQSMGALVAALEELGMVERTPHPTDGRQQTLALTAHGKAFRKSAKDARHTWLANAIAQLEVRDQATLFAASHLIKRLAES